MKATVAPVAVIAETVIPLGADGGFGLVVNEPELEARLPVLETAVTW